jgi:hypothetical protein
MRKFLVRSPIFMLAAMALLGLPEAAVQAQPIESGFFNSPNFGTPPTTTADLGAFPYISAGFSVTESGTYSFGNGFTFPAAVFLYANAFNPAMPLENILFGASNEPFEGNPGTPFFQSLLAGINYVVVVSTFFNNETEVPVSSPVANIGCPNACAPGQIVTVTSVVPEPSTVLLSASGLFALAFAARRRGRTPRS